MRTFLRLGRGPARVCFQICCCALTSTSLLGWADQIPRPDSWPRVHIEDAFTRAAVEWSLTGAAQWLTDERCREVLSEFRGIEGRPLTDRLDILGVDIHSYLRLILFRDGAPSAQCAGELTFAVTKPGGRVVFVCGRKFERLWRTDTPLARAVIIHQVLHTLGLGENPPPSSAITSRVRALCDPAHTRDGPEPDSSRAPASNLAPLVPELRTGPGWCRGLIHAVRRGRIPVARRGRTPVA